MDFSYLAFKGNIFDCDNDQEEVAPILIVTIVDEDGEDKTDEYNFLMEKAKHSDECLEGCEDFEEGCHCKPGGSNIFNLEDQIARIFSNSNLRKLVNNHPFAGWEIYNNGVFWIIFSFSIIVEFPNKLSNIRASRRDRDRSRYWL